MMKNSGGMGFEGMAPEDIFAMGIKKGLELVKDAGRNGDTELAHVNPEEKQMLEAQGGAGTRNPMTGMPEYFGSDMEGERGRDTGVGGRDSGAAGGGNRSDMERERGRQTGVRGDTAQAGRSDMEANRVRTGVSSSPTSTGDSTVSSDMDAQKSQTQSSPPDDRNIGQRLGDAWDAAVGGWGFGAPNKTSPGALGSVLEAALPGFGLVGGMVRGLQAAGVPNREKEPGELGTDEYSGQRDGDVLTPRRPQPQKPPAAAPAASYAWQRPGAAPTAPGGLNLDAGMTPLQQRTHLATVGTSGNSGVGRDPAVMEFYRNLALYDLTQPGGAPNPGGVVTPIERQYVSQMGGQPGDTTESFLRALAGL